MKRSAKWSCLPAAAFLAASAWAANPASERKLTVTVDNPAPPTLTVHLTPSGGGPKLEGYTVSDDGDPLNPGFDFEDGVTECVVRDYTGRQCHLSWDAPTPRPSRSLPPRGRTTGGERAREGLSASRTRCR